MAKNADKPSDWQIHARAFLQKLGLEEWREQGRPIPDKRLRHPRRYCPSAAHVAMIEALNENDEEKFKALKLAYLTGALPTT